MKKIKYFVEFIIIIILFIIFKILGLRLSSYIGGKILEYIGPFFRSKKIIKKNIHKAYPNINSIKLKKITKNMWNNYGRILSEYIFMKNFRDSKINSNLIIEGYEVLQKIKKENNPVIFVSGHFSNFELMAMQIEKSGVSISALYRPLNNIFLNIVMEKIRTKYICKKQIKKGFSGMRKLLTSFKSGNSIALMIDQRVSEGIKSKFFGVDAYTTTIPAQFVKKFNCQVVPVYIERLNGVNFKMKFSKPLKFDNSSSIKEITKYLNQRLEKMILNNPNQWIWSHNRWK
ncbi:lysophospholipid acyltransferase family protein [Candidatus Pelagibacter sp.]|nr:lysophospholipid acyltransferase family protein [Candidatus Pelagibacter sp.]